MDFVCALPRGLFVPRRIEATFGDFAAPRAGCLSPGFGSASWAFGVAGLSWSTTFCAIGAMFLGCAYLGERRNGGLVAVGGCDGVGAVGCVLVMAWQRDHEICAARVVYDGDVAAVQACCPPGDW